MPLRVDRNLTSDWARYHFDRFGLDVRKSFALKLPNDSSLISLVGLSFSGSYLDHSLFLIWMARSNGSLFLYLFMRIGRSASY